MQPVSFRSIYEPVGRGDKALVISGWLFAFIAQHALKGAHGIVVPMTPNNLAIGSANGCANHSFHSGKDTTQKTGRRLARRQLLKICAPQRPSRHPAGLAPAD
jgi:hypothetical protein